MKINEAIIFATEKHGSQMYGPHPYVYHLINVSAKAIAYGLSEDVVVACFLHDVLEDTNATLDEIQDKFGDNVADIVHRVTDKQGNTREKRHLNTYPAISESEEATLVKLCDRIANVEYSLQCKNMNKMKMYVKDHPLFVKMLYSDNKLEEYLDSLISECKKYE